MRTLRVSAALLIAAFALTGCMKIDLKVTIDGERDVINGTMVFAMDKGVLTMGGKTPEQAFASSAESLQQIPKGTRSEVYDDGKFYGRTIIFENVTFQEFNSGGDGTPTFVHADGKYTFTMDADLSGAALGDSAGAAKPFLDTIEVKVSVTFPGKVIDRDNLAQLDGNTVSWQLKMGSAHKLKAVSEEPAKLRWLLLAGVVALFGLLAVIGIVVLAIRLNRSRRPAAPLSDADSDADSGPPPAQVEPDHGDLEATRRPAD